jgi:putative ABC transport system permease protein
MWPFRHRSDDDFREEIEAHLAIETDRLIAEGLSPEEARHRARRAFGNATSAQERFYESRRVLWFEELRQDGSYALRALRRSPGFAAVAILTLALGIGANTAIFSVVNAVLLRPLPYHDPGTLVLIEPAELGLTPEWLLPAWRDRARTLSGLIGFTEPRAATLIDRGGPHPIRSTDVTWDFLGFLGVAPVLGRDFTEADAEDGAPAVGILSDDLWRRRFGGQADAIGRTVTVSGVPVTIVGVAPPDFRFPAATARTVGLPVDTQPELLRVAGQRSLHVIGRLRPGATPASASDELLAIFRREGAKEFSASLLDRERLSVASLQDRLVGNLPQRLSLVMGAVVFVLMVGCANVANLLLARASTRHHELAVRSALGAPRGRLARLLLTESVLLALLGSIAALVFAYTTRGVVRALLAERIPHVESVSIDLRVMAFNLALAVVTGVLCGLAALPVARRVDLAAVFTNVTRSVTGRGLMRRALLSVEAAVTFVLVVGAALFAQTLWNLAAEDKGFDADQMLTVRVTPGAPGDIARSERQPGTDFRAQAVYFSEFFGGLRSRLERIPGVVDAGAISLGPLEGTSSGLCCVAVAGRPTPSGEESLTPVGFVTPGYLRTMRIPLVAGRDFTESDRLGTERVAIVNQEFQRRFVPDGAAVGARITDVRGTGQQDFTIVGVARDTPDRSLREGPEPHIILPLAQMPAGFITWTSLTFVLRTEVDPLSLAPAVRQAVWAIDPNIVIADVATMEERVAAGMRVERDSALLFGLFAVAALVMAAIGVYGVAAYSIAQRTREIGIRVALGAARHDVRRLVVSQTLWPTVAGISFGLAAAVVLTRLMTSMVYGVTPLDPATFAGGVIALMTVALAGTWVPARRATQIDPLEALRYE